MILFYFYIQSLNILNIPNNPAYLKKKKKKGGERKKENRRGFFFFFYKISLKVQHGDQWMYDGEISFFK